MSKISPHEGYFFAHDYIEADDDGRPIDRKRIYNVVGKFCEHEMVDNAKTAALEAAGKLGRVMRSIPVLRERILKDAADQMSKDEVVTKVTPRNQEALVERYPEAWKAYQASKRPARKPRQAKDGGADIVELSTASARG